VALSDITPVILTFDEEENIGRALESLREFPRVVVVDSGSTDRTEEISRSFGNVAWFVHTFEGHVRQWRYALAETGIESPFVLALDADMAVTAVLSRQLSDISVNSGIDGGVIPFEYRIRGVPLAGSIYPPRLRLLRVGRFEVADAGHTQELRVAGTVMRMSGALIHDDRKPLERFVNAQLRYSGIELPRLARNDGGASAKSRLRRSFPFTPLLVWLLAWLRAGGPFGGAAARRYALERLIYESMLRWRVEDELLRRCGDAGSRRER
jgi:glycosyltransferase involved in cell wall biosynthesis